MKNKGLVIFFTVLLTVLCIYTLSFTWVVRKVEDKAKAFATKGSTYNPELYKAYLDSVGLQDVYNLGVAKFNYLECKERELNLGLDLQGGMNVVLEVSKAEVMKGLAGSIGSTDKDFENALAQTQAEYTAKGGDYVDLFIRNFRAVAPNRTLTQIFVNNENEATLTYNSTDEQIIAYIKDQVNDAVSRTRQVVETRLNQANATQPIVQQLDGGRISVELPGVDNPQRVRKLLQSSAKLEFWRVYGNNDKGYAAFNLFETINKVLAQKNKLAKTADSTVKDSASADVDLKSLGKSNEDNNTSVDTASKVLAGKDDSLKKTAADSAAAKEDPLKQYPLLEAGLNIDQTKEGNVIKTAHMGVAYKGNRDKIMKLLQTPEVVKAIPPDVRFRWEAKARKEITEAEYYNLYALRVEKDGKPILTGDKIIQDAYASPGQSGGIEITMRMTDAAAVQWKRITAQNIKDYIAITLDDQVYSAPSVNEEIPNGSSSISGSYDQDEAEDLANVLKAGKLPAPATIIAEDVVGPTLGKESINEGLNALLLGIISVVLFMVLYYMRGGLYAIVAVLLNIFFNVGLLASLGASLSLSGMAGIVLTIGMAVDANVLIYERIKEELFAGKALKTAVSNGYKAAFSSIIDSNLTTLLAGVVMLFAGAGPVYGFAITLIIGILSSLFTAIYVTRIFIDNRLNKDKPISFYNNATKNFLMGKNFNFIANRKKFYLISLIIIVSGVVVLFAKGGLTSGIDFKGGWGYQVQMSNTLSSEQIKATMDKNLPGSSNEVKTIGSDGRFKIVTTYKIDDPNAKADSIQNIVIDALKTYNVKKTDILSSTVVGPTMASDARNKSVIVFVVALVLMFIYILFRFKNLSFSIGAIIALVHDVMIVFALYAFLDGYLPFAMEIDQTFIAAILTIVGYSINDTVVVFDRIREFMTNYKSERNLPKLINDAINQTLSRTIMTSMTTLAVVIVLFIFGGVALKSFAFALLIGIIAGTYSSICIATPIVVDLFKKNNAGIGSDSGR